MEKKKWKLKPVGTLLEMWQIFGVIQLTGDNLFSF